MTATSSRIETRYAGRINVIDALRGFALLGILLVNVQSFTWGAGNPLGYFANVPAGMIDQLAYALLAIFVAGKFYVIFSFLFGVGFSLQLRSMRRVARQPGDELRLYRRRLVFLLLLGIAHGTLLYFGDVLTAYAFCGFMLLLYADIRPARLVRACVRWWVAAMAVSLGWLGLVSLVPAEQPGDIPELLWASRQVYLNDAYAGQLSTRVSDYLNQNLFSAPIFWPQVVAIFLLGAIAGRQGWLRHPQRHPRVWRNAMALGLLLGLPCAVMVGVMQTRSIRDLPGGLPLMETWLGGLASWLAAAYVAAFVRWQGHPTVQMLMAWFASAGRMPLTNYLTQSLIMGALLSGWGLALGDRLDHVNASVLAFAIYAMQIGLSRWIIARYRQGPMEALWRRWTYGMQSTATPTGWDQR